MNERALDEFLRFRFQRPTGQRGSGLRDVFFRVMSLAEREKFHAFAREILVRVVFAALRLVEPDKHRRIFARFGEQFEPVADREAPEQFILPPDIIRVADFFEAGRKMPVPKKRHFFLKWPRTFGHPLQPPTAQFEDALVLYLTLLLLHLLTLV